MKKILFTVAALLAASTTFAQTILWDGDNKLNGDENFHGWWGDSQPELVNNPSTDGLNKSANCLKFISKAGEGYDYTIKIKPESLDLTKSKRISFLIKKEFTENVQVEITNSKPKEEGGYWVYRAIWCDGTNDWQKLVFDFQESDKDFSNASLISIRVSVPGDYQGDAVVYIDDLVVEDAPTVDGKLLSEITDGSLLGDLKLTGAWLKGSCKNPDEKNDKDEWVDAYYDDYGTLKSKLTSDVTSVDMTGVYYIKDADPVAFTEANPNTIVYMPDDYTGTIENGNVVVKGNALADINIADANAFSAPIGFHADKVNFTRTFYQGYNTVILPFEVTKDDNGFGSELESLSIFKEINDDKASVVFTTTDKVEANTPFIAKYPSNQEDKASVIKETIEFNDKTFVATPESLGSGFVGTYSKIDGVGLYGINGNGDAFAKGASDSFVTPFHAYLNLPNATVAAYSIDLGGGTTGITSVENGAGDAKTDVYSISGVKVRSGVSSSSALQNLSKGIYIVNGKKVIVK